MNKYLAHFQSHQNAVFLCLKARPESIEAFRWGIISGNCGRFLSKEQQWRIFSKIASGPDNFLVDSQLSFVDLHYLGVEVHNYAF